MPIYHLNCTDQIRHQCEEQVRVNLDIVGLTDEQLEAIEQGRTFRLDAAQVKASGLELDAEQRAVVQRKGYLDYHVDIDSICETCGADMD